MKLSNMKLSKKRGKIEPEAICSKHVALFTELVECNDCNIYPQETINEQVRIAYKEGYAKGHHEGYLGGLGQA